MQKSADIDNPSYWPRLSFIEQLGHARRVRSARSALLSVVGTLCRRVLPRWWLETAPWYAGRMVERLGLQIKVDGNVIELDSSSGNPFVKGLLWLGIYESKERYAAARFVIASLPVVEFGAAVGVVGCLCNRFLADPKMQVSVEANPSLIPTLERNRDINGRDFTIVHGAVAYGVQTVEFGVADRLLASSIGADGAVRTVAVPAVSLASVLSNAKFELCTLICDIEGAEVQLVSAEADVLRRCVRMLMLELHPAMVGATASAAIGTRLHELGFLPVWHKGDVWVFENRSLA